MNIYAVLQVETNCPVVFLEHVSSLPKKKRKKFVNNIKTSNPDEIKQTDTPIRVIDYVFK